MIAITHSMAEAASLERTCGNGRPWSDLLPLARIATTLEQFNAMGTHHFIEMQDGGLPTHNGPASPFTVHPIRSAKLARSTTAIRVGRRALMVHTEGLRKHKTVRYNEVASHPLS
jgi:hypothetical protein